MRGRGLVGEESDPQRTDLAACGNHSEPLGANQGRASSGRSVSGLGLNAEDHPASRNLPHEGVS